MRIRGLEPRHGETAFAFLVLRFQRALNREALVAVIQKIAPMIPDADAFISELPDDLDQVMRIVGMPWLPGEDEDAAEEQRAVLANVNGIETAWFFQTGTGLPSVDDESDEDDSDREDEPDEDEGWSQKIEVEDVDDDDEEDTGEHAVIGSDEDDDDDDEEDVVWSHGPPAQVREVRFPVDGYPAILEEHDWEDFGIAFKLAGDWLPGESTVLLGFHALWLAPYGGRYRNAAVTIDSKHHAAHLWVDRFAVPITAAEQVHHLLWVLSKIDEVTPVLHARFAGATMAQKYGGLMGDTAEPFVLGGNPLLEIHDEGGERAVDAWLDAQTEWSKDELAQMLRELAIELVTSSDEEEEVSTAVTPALEEVEQVEDEHGGDDDDDDEDDDEDEDDDDEDDDGEEEGDDDEDRGRQVTRFAGELLAARAAAGALDARVAARLRPLLEISEKYEHRRGAVVDVLGALRDRAAVPQMIEILRDTPIASSLDSIGKEDFLVKIANALGAIGDPSAIPALANVVRASGDYNDDPRAPAAEALASCLAAGPEPRDVDDSVLAALLLPIEQRNDGEANADLHLAYGRLASVLAPARRKVAHDRLAAITSRRTDATPALARKAALLLAHAGTPDRAALDELRPLVHDALTRLDYAHEYTVRNIRIGLRIGEALPELITPDDLAWLTRFTEPEIRARAHALLTKLGRPLVPAPVFDRASAKALAERTLVGLIADPHVVGRAALIAEAGNRRLASARGAIIAAADAAIARAREGGANLLDPDTAILAASVRALRTGPLEIEAIGLFDRMLRHGNHHVKWELLQEPPKDERLIGGMFHVLGEKWGWQEKTARAWLAEFQGSPAYEAERSRDEMN